MFRTIKSFFFRISRNSSSLSLLSNRIRYGQLVKGCLLLDHDETFCVLIEFDKFFSKSQQSYDDIFSFKLPYPLIL